ncbi:hypothetical protein CEXT_307141 [Caerostris extrusa]|uniref:TF-B3 domain-containing protein n=1 Tax=Caerostris extrusa TaxID=172846 RepID=A0AAV4UVQ4_CAEEX|nr:hypothetical protein CEXT_307141 [Caerostris extrusa]
MGFCSADWSHRPESQALSRSNCWKASKGHDNSEERGKKFLLKWGPLRTLERPFPSLGVLSETWKTFCTEHDFFFAKKIILRLEIEEGDCIRFLIQANDFLGVNSKIITA